MQKSKFISVFVAAIAFAGVSFAQEANTTNTVKGNSFDHAVYSKAGFPGVGFGYAYGLNKSFGLRADVTTIGSYSGDKTSDNLNYNAKLNYNQAGVYGDFFPFESNFRLTAGLNFRDAKVTGDGRPNGNNQLTVGDTTVTVNSNDIINARIKMPSVAPYLGIGWGLNTAASSKGWSFFADIGVTIGKPKVSLQANQSLMDKLDAVAVSNGSTGQAELDKQTAQLKKDADKLKFIPQVFVGVAYKF